MHGENTELRNGWRITFFAMEAVLYLCFMCIDIIGGPVFLSSALKYAGILLCVGCITVRSLRLKNKTACYVCGAIVFTAVSDFFLLFTEIYLPGVIAFCITQTFYLAVLLRGLFILGSNINLSSPETFTGVSLRQPLKAGMLLFVPGFLPAVVAPLLLKNKLSAATAELLLISAAAFYAFSFLRNLVLSVILWSRTGKKDGSGELRTGLFAAGLILFVLCDINVLLYNLPGFISVESTALSRICEYAGCFMWFFYLPSQLMLVCSPKRR